jgi:nicotinamidase-related amidase
MSLAKRSEKGLLTPDNCVVALIDFQPQMLFGVTSIDRQSLISNVLGFSKAAKLFDVPVILSTVESKGFSGNIWPQLQAQFPGVAPIERSTMNAWDDENFVAAVKATRRKKIVLAGLWTQACVTYPSVQAIEDGYEVYVVEDLCGDLDVRTHDTAMRRVEQAGAKPVTWVQVMLELQRDWALTETYPAVMDIAKHHIGAYGVGVEYAKTMIHGEPPTPFHNWERPAPPAQSASEQSEIKLRLPITVGL